MCFVSSTSQAMQWPAFLRATSLLLLCSSTVALHPSLHANRRCITRRAAPDLQLSRRQTTRLIVTEPSGDSSTQRQWSRLAVGAACLLLALDTSFYTFPLPFLGSILLEAGHTPAAISNLVASFTYTALLAGGANLVLAARRTTSRTPPQLFRTLAALAAIVCVMAGAQAARPTYLVLLLSRLVQGAATQTAWPTALAVATALPPMFGISATAWVWGGSSVGEVLGPKFGAELFRFGGERLPFAIAALLAALLARPSPASSAGLSSSGRWSSRRRRSAWGPPQRLQQGGDPVVRQAGRGRRHPRRQLCLSAD